LPCGDWLGFQVRLDRLGFSPGEIDAKAGANVAHALKALQSSKSLPSTGDADCATWQALGGDGSDAAITTYSVTTLT